MKTLFANARTTLLGLALACLAGTASAATSFSDALTSFTGDSSQPATYAALATAGFDFASYDGFIDTGGVDDKDPRVVFDSAGAHFGSLIAGDAGRNYMRTIAGDYATDSFTADITFTATDLATQDIFLGVGTGDIALFGWPDWSTLVSSVLVLPEITDGGVSQLTTFRTADDVNAFANTAAPAMLNGTHRVRVGFNASAKTAAFSIDVNYAGGAYVADYNAAPVDISGLFNIDGWPTTEPSRVYFGGDDGIVIKDFSVSIGPVVGLFDVDGDGVVDGKELLVWQRGLGINSGATLQQGDADGDGAVKKSDLLVWKSQYGTGYAVPAIGAVPEPSTAVLALGGVIMLAVRGIRRGRLEV
jgi:hypothetical protein